MATAVHPLSIANFRAFVVARLSTTLAQNAMVVVIGWQVYDIARRTMNPQEAAFQLGLIGLFQFVPLLLLTLVVGWVADRVDRRWIARTAVLMDAGCAGALAWLGWTNATTLPLLFLIAVVLGISRAFASPALQALAPNLVPAASLPTAIALSSIAWQFGAIAGPATGGYLYAGGHGLPYTVACFLFLVAFLCLMTIGPVGQARAASGAKPWRQMIEGLHYMRRNRIVLGAISLDLFAVLLGGATAMLPVYAKDVLHVGAEGLGHLRAAPAVGAAATALWFSFRPLKNDVGVKLLLAVATFGAATIVFGLSRNMVLSLGALVVLGVADMISVYVRQSLVQLSTPDDMRGRVGAVSTLFISGSNELGEAESGFLAASVGPIAAVVAGGAGAVLIALAWSRLFPELRRVRSFVAPQIVADPDGREKTT